MSAVRRVPIAVRLLSAVIVPLVVVGWLLAAQVSESRSEGRAAAAELDRLHLGDAAAQLQSVLIQPELLAHGIGPVAPRGATLPQRQLATGVWAQFVTYSLQAVSAFEDAERRYGHVMPAGGREAFAAQIAALETMVTGDPAMAVAASTVEEVRSTRQRADAALSDLYLSFDGDAWLAFQARTSFLRTSAEEFAAVVTTLAGMEPAEPAEILALTGARRNAVLALSLGSSRTVHQQLKEVSDRAQFRTYEADVTRAVQVAQGRRGPDSGERLVTVITTTLALQDDAVAIGRGTVAESERTLAAGVERARRQELTSWLTAAGVLTLTLLLSTLTLRSILPPLGDLTRRAKELGAGRLDGVPVAPGGRDELARLGQALESSAATLGHVNAQAQAIADGRLDDPSLDVPAPGALGDVLHQNVLAVRRMAAQLRHDAEHDPLTGLLNRSALERRVADPQDDLDVPLPAPETWLLFLDLDGFKRVNDTFGHRQGDDVLRAVSQRLLRAVRPEDLVARIGGDEFAVVVRLEPGAGRVLLEETMRRLAEAVRAPVPRRRADHDPPTGEQPDVGVGVSIGAAPLRPGDTLEQALAAADAQMYVVKHARTTSAPVSA